MSERIPLEEWKAQKQAERENLANKQMLAMYEVSRSDIALCLYFMAEDRWGLVCPLVTPHWS